MNRFEICALDAKCVDCSLLLGANFEPVHLFGNRTSAYRSLEYLWGLTCAARTRLNRRHEQAPRRRLHNQIAGGGGRRTQKVKTARGMQERIRTSSRTLTEGILGGGERKFVGFSRRPPPKFPVCVRLFGSAPVSYSEVFFCS